MVKPVDEIIGTVDPEKWYTMPELKALFWYSSHDAVFHLVRTNQLKTEVIGGTTKRQKRAARGSEIIEFLQKVQHTPSE